MERFCVSEIILCNFRGKFSVFEEIFCALFLEIFFAFQKNIWCDSGNILCISKNIYVIQKTFGALLKKDFVYLRKHFVHIFKKYFLHFLERDFVHYRKDFVYFCKHFVYFGKPWPTKYTALYVTFWRPKLRDQFSENLVLWIYEFLFNFCDRISNEKKIMELLRIGNLKYDKNFQLTHCCFN